MSEKAINDLYIKTYGRPASAQELNFHSNVYGSDLDATESKDLYNRMVSVPGYTPPSAGGDVDTGVSTDPVTPPNTSSPATSSPEVASTPAYTTEEEPQGMGVTETVYRGPSGNIITREEALQLQATTDAQAEADIPFVADEQSTGYENYMGVLGREPESQAAQEEASGLTREQFFQRAIPELRRTSPIFSTFNQVLARDPRLGGLDYYRNVRPDLMQDPRAFRQAAIDSGEFGSRARDLYRENMGFDPSQSALQGLIQSGTYLNPNEFRGAIARQNLASRSRYIQPDYGFTPYRQPQPRFNPYAMPPPQRFSQPFRSSFNQPIYSPYGGSRGFSSSAPAEVSPMPPEANMNQYQSQQPAPIGGKGGQRMTPMRGGFSAPAGFGAGIGGKGAR